VQQKKKEQKEGVEYVVKVHLILKCVVKEYLVENKAREESGRKGRTTVRHAKAEGHAKDGRKTTGNAKEACIWKRRKSVVEQ
jgi:hypothetical protein